MDVSTKVSVFSSCRALQTLRMVTGFLRPLIILSTVKLWNRRFTGKLIYLLQLCVVFLPVLSEQLLCKLEIKKKSLWWHTDGRAPWLVLNIKLYNNFNSSEFTFFLLSSLTVRSSLVFCSSWLANVPVSGTTSLSSASSRACSSSSMTLSRFLRCSKLAFFSSSSFCLLYADILKKQRKRDLSSGLICLLKPTLF